jgi:hypothetical protein
LVQAGCPLSGFCECDYSMMARQTHEMKYMQKQAFGGRICSVNAPIGALLVGYIKVYLYSQTLFPQFLIHGFAVL